MHTRNSGNIGEDLAITYLESCGYMIRERNVYVPRGEIDIVAKYQGKTVFVEVKYRTSYMFGSALESLTHRKQQRFMQAVSWYCMQHQIPLEHIGCMFLAIQQDGKNISYDLFEDISEK